ncbi:hypothetical protein HYPSUDRAFT_527976 [Hypholoma sublateritium FD-334 SS-4]|uniref:Uncharacterized protein n=1 Tax=Hypholoma sublateritium (strain FD-334 SS-4) TaxID=945553 RepID=A0A0D2LAY2_HYPSF|nr:hypothetical protein HYPSUDRAFT_527976 [Hypholoma sublateritium FD-334 SS-4]
MFTVQLIKTSTESNLDTPEDASDLSLELTSLVIPGLRKVDTENKKLRPATVVTRAEHLLGMARGGTTVIYSYYDV